MLRLMSGLLWCLACGLFILLGATFLTKQYFPATEANFSSAGDVLGEMVVAQSQEESSGGGQVSEQEQARLVRTADARAHLVANFIERNDRDQTSPLQPYAEWGAKFVAVADEYGLDFRLLPAIARKESTFCKSNVALTYYNCFGFGVPASGITEAGKFSSFEEGMQIVAASLKKNYLDQGLTDPEAIMRKYCPPSDGSWASELNGWLAEMRYDDKTAAREASARTDLTEFIVEN